MLGFKKRTADQSQNKEEADACKWDQEFAASWVDDITAMCAAHLAQVASFSDNAWEEAERSGDLHEVIMHYSAAVDGTDDFTNEAFKEFEERAEQLEFLKNELTNYTKIRKLQHKMQLRFYFYCKLQLSIIPAGANRDSQRKDIIRVLNPELSKQF